MDEAAAGLMIWESEVPKANTSIISLRPGVNVPPRALFTQFPAWEQQAKNRPFPLGIPFFEPKSL